jgi:hypothetical protein
VILSKINQISNKIDPHTDTINLLLYETARILHATSRMVITIGPILCAVHSPCAEFQILRIPLLAVPGQSVNGEKSKRELKVQGNAEPNALVPEAGREPEAVRGTAVP